MIRSSTFEKKEEQVLGGSDTYVKNTSKCLLTIYFKFHCETWI